MNAVRETLEAELDKIKSSMETAAMNARLEEEKIDITLPGRAPKNRTYSSFDYCKRND